MENPNPIQTNTVPENIVMSADALSKKFIIKIFLLCLAIAPVPLYMCGDSCSVQGFGPLIFGPVSLLGIPTLFQWLPWFFAILFSVIITSIIYFIYKISNNKIKKPKILSFIFIGFVFFIVWGFLSFNYSSSSNFKFTINAIMEHKSLDNKNYLAYAKSGNNQVQYDAFTQSIFAGTDYNSDLILKDKEIVYSLQYLRVPNNSSDFCNNLKSYVDSSPAYKTILSGIKCVMGPNGYLYYIKGNIGNKYFCLGDDMISGSVYNIPNMVYSIDSEPTQGSLSCFIK